MIKRMSGDRREWNYPILYNGIDSAVTNKEKAELMMKMFVKVHSSNNLSEEARRSREKTKSENMAILRKKVLRMS